MSGVFRLCVLLVAIATAFGRSDKHFPTCEELVDHFGKKEVYLFSDGEGVRNIFSTECIAEDRRFKTVYYCYDGVELLTLDESNDLSFEPIELPFTEIHNFSSILADKDDKDNTGILCYNPREPVAIPTGSVPTSTQRCSETSQPSRRSQYASNEKNICFGSCSFERRTNGISAGTRVNTVTQCCPGYKLQRSSSRFSFAFRGGLATCVPE